MLIVAGVVIALIAGLAYFFLSQQLAATAPKKIGPMEVPAASTPAALPTAQPEDPAPPAPVEPEPVAALPELQQPKMVPDVPLPESPKAPADLEPIAPSTARPAPVSSQPVRPSSQPVRPAQVEPQQSPSAPAPAAIGKTCSQASLLLRPMCVVKGAATFWKCAPNGKRWDNNIPGCRRGNDNDGLNR